MAGKFIVGSVHKKTGAFSISINPKRHASFQLAEAEAERLATRDTSKKFVVFEIKSAYSNSQVVKVDI